MRILNAFRIFILINLVTINEFITKKEQMKLTEELWSTFGFEPYYSMGWKLMFEDFILMFEADKFPNTVEQLLMLLRDYYLGKGELVGIYKTKKHLREFLEVKD